MTLELTGLAMLLALAVGVPLGVLAATRRRNTGRATTALAIAGIAIPDFWLGIMLVLVIAGTFRLLPPSGYVPFFEDPVANIRYMILPVITLAFAEIAYILRTTRASMEETLGSPFVTFLRAKGVSDRSITYRHALRSAAVPIVTVVGIQVGVLHRRRHRGGGAVRAAGDRQDAGHGHQPAQLPRGPGRDPGRGVPVHPREPDHRPAVRRRSTRASRRPTRDRHAHGAGARLARPDGRADRSRRTPGPRGAPGVADARRAPHRWRGGAHRVRHPGGAGAHRGPGAVARAARPRGDGHLARHGPAHAGASVRVRCVRPRCAQPRAVRVPGLAVRGGGRGAAGVPHRGADRAVVRLRPAAGSTRC